MRVTHICFTNIFRFFSPGAAQRIEGSWAPSRLRRLGNDGWGITMKAGNRPSTQMVPSVSMVDSYHWDLAWTRKSWAFPWVFRGFLRVFHQFRSSQEMQNKLVTFHHHGMVVHIDHAQLVPSLHLSGKQGKQSDDSLQKFFLCMTERSRLLHLPKKIETR